MESLNLLRFLLIKEKEQSSSVSNGHDELQQ